MLKQRVALFLRQAFIAISLVFMHNCAVDFQDLSESSSSNTSSTETSSGGSSTPVAFTTTWDFSTSGDYTVSSATKIAISGNAALQLVDQTHSASADFSSGTHVGTQYTASTLTTGDAGGCDGSSKNCFWSLDESWTPQWASLVSYWEFEETSWDGTADEILDSVGTNTGYRTGDATTTTDSKIGSYSGTFDGAGDRALIPNDSSQNPTTMTVSLWSYRVTGSNQYWAAITNEDYAGKKGYYLGDTNNLTGDEVLCVRLNGSDGNAFRAYESSVTLDEWVHYVFTFDGDKIRLYKNGILEATTDPGFATVVSSASNLSISSGFNGKIDDVALWDTALTTAEVVTIYNTQASKYVGHYTSPVLDTGNTAATWTAKSWVTELPFYKELTGVAGSESSANYSSLVGSTGSTSDNDLMSNLIGLWHLNNDSNDYSTRGNNGALTGASYSTSALLGTHSTSFDGSGDYITITDSDYDFSHTDDFSISAWVSISDIADSVAGQQRGIFTQGRVDDRYGIVKSWSTPKLMFFTDGGTNDYVTTTTSLEQNKWYHVIATFDGSTREKKIYLNSVMEDSGTAPNEDFYRSGDPTFIGKSLWGSDDKPFEGSIDEVAVWSRVLDPSEITQLYRRGANRIKMQVRSCDDAACSGEAWVGPDGNNDTYLSELNNCDLLTAATGACDFAGGADVNLTSPSLDFTDFTNLSSAVTANQYYQYRVIMESDDDTNSTMPSLSSLTIGPAHYYGDNPTVELATAQSFATLTSFAVTETGTCDHRYQLSNDDGSTYYYYDGASWTAVANVTTHVNTQADVNTNIGTLPVGSGELKWKAILQSDTTENCTIDDVVIGGTQ